MRMSILTMGETQVPARCVVERGVAARDGLQAVVEVEDDLVQRQLVGEHDAGLGDVLEVLLAAALVFDELEDAADVLFVGEDLGDDDGLFDLLDLGGVGPARGIVDLDDAAVGQGDLVAHAGSGGDEVEVVLALEPLLNDLEMEQAEEAAAEAEAERDGGLGLEGEGRVVEAKLFERVAQHGVLVRVDGVEAGEDHALDVFEAGQRFGAGIFDRGDGVADLGVGYVLDGRDEEADFARGEFGESRPASAS